MFKIKDKVRVINELMPLALNSVHIVTAVKDTFIGLDDNVKNLYAAVAFELVPKVDPYAELKQAYAEGKTIELYSTSIGWAALDTTYNAPSWGLNASAYRIKPTQFESELIQHDIDVLNVILAKALKGIIDLEIDVTSIQSKLSELKKQL